MTGGGWSAGCGFADYDRDGDLDLFVSRYVKIDLDEPARVRQGQDLRVPRHRGAVRPPRAARRRRPPLPQRRQRHASPRWARRRGSPIPRGLLRPRASPGSTTNEDGWPDLYVANDSTPSFLYLNQKDGTFKESGLPHGRGGQRGRRRAGQHGRGASATTTAAGRFSLFKTNFAEEYNTLYRNEGDPLHGRVVPLEDRGQQPALRGLGHGASSTTTTTAGWTSSSPTATSTRRWTRRGWARPPATASGKLLYHNRGDGTFDEVAAQLRAGAHGGAGEPRPGRRRPRRRRAPRRRHQRPRRRAPGAAQRARRSRATGCS